MKTVYVKVTNKCNLRCKHCYNAECTEVGLENTSMSNELFNGIMAYHIVDTDTPANIILHGGEPMIWIKEDLDNYKSLMLTLGFILDSRIKHELSITTNLVYSIDSDILALFKKMSEQRMLPAITTSWDYDIRFADGTENLWKSNVKYLVRNGVPVRVTVTVTQKVLELDPAEIFDMCKDLGVWCVNFERLTVNGRAKENTYLIPKNRDVDNWLYRAYRYVKENGYFVVPLFECLEASKAGILTGCRARECTKNVITYNPDASIASCPNISNTLIGSDEYQCACQQEQLRNNECYTCDYFKVCNGDCFQLSWDDTGCAGLKGILGELCS